MIRIYLNSVADSDSPINAPSLWLEATANCQGIEDLELTFNRKDDVAQRAISNQLEFYDGSYDLLYEKLVTDKAEHVWVKIEVDGFGYTFPYLQIRWNAIEWCSDRCSMSANLTTWDTDIDKYKLLRSTLVWDVDFLNNLVYDNPFTGVSEDAHPLMRLRWEKGGVTATKEWSYGLVGVYLRHYFFNLCDKIGLTPSSSIFEYDGLNGWSGDSYDDIYYDVPYQSGIPVAKTPKNPYYNAAVFINATATSDDNGQYDFLKIGQSTRPSPNELDNALNKNGIEFLNEFGQVFNAKYRIKNGLLEFERKDYFFQSQNVWVDLSNKNQCLKLKPQDNWAYLRLEYSDESSLWSKGNALLERGTLNYTPQQAFQINPPYPIFAEKYYDEIVEWNSPVSTRQEGELNRVLPFAKLRTKLNGTERSNNSDRFGLYCWSLQADIPFLACVRESGGMNKKNIYQSYDYLESGGVWNENYNRPFFAKKQSTAELDSGQTYQLNWEGTLYDNFHFIDDPRRRPNNRGYYAKEPYKSYEYTITADFDCDMLNNFDIDSVIETQQGTASMEEVVFNFKNLEVEIKGFV